MHSDPSDQGARERDSVYGQLVTGVTMWDEIPIAVPFFGDLSEG